MDQELTHHGVKGQKWGRRRYQNPDGSLTPAGRKRYGVESNYQRSTGEHNAQNKPRKLFGKKKSDDDIPEENRYLSKKARSMTDKELDKAIERLQKEQRLKQISPEEIERTKKLMDDQSYRKKSLNQMTDEEIVRSLNRANLERQYKQAYPEHVSAGKKFMQGLMNDVVAPAAKSAGRDFLEKSLKKFGENLLKDKVDPDSIDALKKVKDKLGLKKDIKDLQDELSGKKKKDSDETSKQLKERLTAEDWLYDNDPDWRAANPEKAAAAKLRKAEAAAKEAKNTKSDTPGDDLDTRRKQIEKERWFYDNDPDWRAANPDWGEKHDNNAAKAKADRDAKAKADAEAKAKKEAKSFVDDIINKAERLALPAADNKANKAWDKSQKKAEKDETDRVNKMKDDLKSKLNQMKDNIKWTRDDDGFEILDPEPRSKSTNNNSRKTTNDTVINVTDFKDIPDSTSNLPIVYSPSTSVISRNGQSFTNQWGQYLLSPWEDDR